MKDWNYAYDNVSKEQWLHRIKSDLGNQSIESLAHEWWPGEIIFPAHHIADLEGEPVILPDRLFINSPRIVEWIPAAQMTLLEIQKRINNSLLSGAQSLIFDLEPKEIIFDPHWLDGVYTNMIEVGVNVYPDDNASITQIQDLPSIHFIRFIRNQDSRNTFPDSILLNSSASTRYRFIYEIPLEGDWIPGAIDMFQNIISDLSAWNALGLMTDEFINQCIILIRPGMDFFKQIVQTRVVHVLWQNLYHSVCTNNSTHSYYLECHIEDNEFKSPDQYLIHASTSALAASLTGVHGLCIHHDEKKDIPEFYHRIHRNIHHLLNLESQIYKGKDPLAGTYTIDFYTKQWAEAIWDGLTDFPKPK